MSTRTTRRYRVFGAILCALVVPAVFAGDGSDQQKDKGKAPAASQPQQRAPAQQQPHQAQQPPQQHSTAPPQQPPQRVQQQQPQSQPHQTQAQTPAQQAPQHPIQPTQQQPVQQQPQQHVQQPVQPQSPQHPQQPVQQLPPQHAQQPVQPQSPQHPQQPVQQLPPQHAQQPGQPQSPQHPQQPVQQLPPQRAQQQIPQPGQQGGQLQPHQGGPSHTADSNRFAHQPAPVYHPPAGVQTTRHNDGSESHFNARTNTTVHTGPGGHVTVIERPNLKASSFRPDGHAGHIEHVREDGSRLVVERRLGGERRVEIVHRDGARVVTEGRHAFVERPYRPGFVSRTYVVNGRPEARVYREQMFHSVHYTTFVPAHYYHRDFYAWADRPWAAPIGFSWGWAPATPWFYAGYFAPEPVYESPALWLTDFLLAANLQTAFAAQQSQGQYQPPPLQQEEVRLSPEVKREIAEEIRRQIASEQQAAAVQPTAVAPAGQPNAAPYAPAPVEANVEPPALKARVFVVSTALDLTGIDDGRVCALTGGDVIERVPRQPITADGKVMIDVMSSKPGDCPAEFAAQLDLAVLQDMQNQFYEQVSAGMASLAANQGKKGMPASPTTQTFSNAAGQAVIDNDAVRLVNEAGQQAEQTENEVRISDPISG